MILAADGCIPSCTARGLTCKAVSLFAAKQALFHEKRPQSHWIRAFCKAGVQSLVNQQVVHQQVQIIHVIDPQAVTTKVKDRIAVDDLAKRQCFINRGHTQGITIQLNAVHVIGEIEDHIIAVGKTVGALEELDDVSNLIDWNSIESMLSHIHSKRRLHIHHIVVDNSGNHVHTYIYVVYLPYFPPVIKRGAPLMEYSFLFIFAF